MKNVELVGVLNVVEDDGSITIISEGDYVTCYISDSEYYIGELTKIGYWQESGTNLFSVAILIDSKKTKRAYSALPNVILLSDIKWIHKMSEEEQKELETLISRISQTDTTANE